MLTSPPRYAQPNLDPLDEADLRLLELLSTQGRASGRDLAMHVGVSEANISRRLARILEEQSARIVFHVPPERLGFHTSFSLNARVHGNPQDAANHLMKFPDFTRIASVFGAWDLMVDGVTTSPETLAALLEAAIFTSNMLHDVEVTTTLRRYTLADGSSQVSMASGKVRIDDTDRQAIQHLQDSGRMSFTDVAQRVGISPTSAADRFRRLTSDGVGQVVTLPDPSRVGHTVFGAIMLKVFNGSSSTLPAVSKVEGVRAVTLTTGTQPITAQFVAQGESDLHRLKAQLLACPGVESVSLAMERKLYLETYRWGSREPLGTAVTKPDET